MPDPSHPDDPKPIGDAASLFDTDEIRPIQRAPGSPARRLRAAPPAASEGYELEGVSFPEVDEPPGRSPIPPPVERPKARVRGRKPKVEPLGPEESGSTEFVTEVSEVNPVWTRWGRVGPGPDPGRGRRPGHAVPGLVVLGTSSSCLLILALGGAATVLLSYPMLITLERPVRITPEQAVTDFYAAASHHFPHYRRMWLLLSALGRESGRFSSFEDFRDHWKGRIERLEAGRRGRQVRPA